MVEYVVPGNIDSRIIARAADLLQNGGTAAIPTDTSWSIVCSLKSRDGIKRLKSFSKERNERLFTLICSSVSQFGELCSMDNTRFRLIKRLTPGPYVFILKTLLGTEKTLNLKRSEIGVRLPDYPVPLALINATGSPLYGITAKRSMAENSQDDSYKEQLLEDDLFEAAWELEDIAGLDMIIDPGEERSRIFTTVLDISSGEAQVLRNGTGPWPV